MKYNIFLSWVKLKDFVNWYQLTNFGFCNLTFVIIIYLQYRVLWNEYYLAEEYPRESFPVQFELPIVQDPAIPAHNVASTDLEDWAQFRRELSKWVAKLTL